MSGEPRLLASNGAKKPKRYSRVAADEDDDSDGGNIVLEVASARARSRHKCAAAAGVAAGCILFVSGALIMFAIAAGWPSALRVVALSDAAPLQAPDVLHPWPPPLPSPPPPPPPPPRDGDDSLFLQRFASPPPPRYTKPPAPPPPTPDAECYASRYPDLLAGFCGGVTSNCDLERLALHFEEHGRAEGRTFACSANPPSPPAPRPPPSLVVKASSVPHPCARLSTPAASAARLQLLESPPHAVDVADGMEHGWIYVDNVKSGSTTVLQRTMATGTWCHGAVVDGVGCTQHFNATLTAPRTCCSTGDRACSRLSTRCLRRADAQRLLLFSFVRDPVAKFESGLRQFYHDDPGAEKLGADAILRKQLAADHWLNEHLQPSWWRLCGADADGQFLPLDYVGRLESFEEDWNRIVKLMPGADAKLRSHYTRPLSAANRRTVGNTSVLSDEGRRLFCRSGLYGEEYAFLRRLGVPYELPSACAE